LTIRAKAHEPLDNPILGFLMRDRLGQDLFGENTLPFTKSVPISIRAGAKFQGVFEFRLPNLPNGQYALMAAEENMIGMAMTNASPLVAPTFSKDKMLGTNPIAIAIPSKISRPFVLDMATTTAANGKLEILQRKNSLAPEGWIQKKDGSLTSNPNELKEGGALRPLGSFPDLGSHKGYGLGASVDILSGVLSGANFGPWVPPFVSFLPFEYFRKSVASGNYVSFFFSSKFRAKKCFVE
jgi:LDH2 family malate/lactate/ureidoglycolate dehydrogenase